MSSSQEVPWGIVIGTAVLAALVGFGTRLSTILFEELPYELPWYLPTFGSRLETTLAYQFGAEVFVFLVSPLAAVGFGYWTSRRTAFDEEVRRWVPLLGGVTLVTVILARTIVYGHYVDPMSSLPAEVPLFGRAIMDAARLVVGIVAGAGIGHLWSGRR